MGKCLWCEKELPAEGADTCTSCLFRSRDEVKPSNNGDNNPENVKENYDLSGLGEDEKSPKKGKGAETLKRELFLNSINKEQNPFSDQEILMKRVKVHSNSIRSKLFVVGDGLVLDFDENGDAFITESDVPAVKAYSRVRPNRLSVVEEPKKARPAPIPAPKKVEMKVEKKTEEKSEEKPVESKSEDKPRRTTKKVSKKEFSKKDEE